MAGESACRPGPGGKSPCARSGSPAPWCSTRRARAFFEALIAGNLDIGRPANVEIIFKRHIRRDTPGVFRTAIDRPTAGPDTGGVVLNLFYKHSRIKQPSSTGQMTYDLRCLRLAGLIRRIEHTNRYVLTPDGIKVAVFSTKLLNRLLRPLLAADQPQAPPELRAALHAIDQHVHTCIIHARLSKPRENLTPRPWC